MPDIIAWLREQYGFELPAEETDVILHFTLLYSLFEFRALAENGHPGTIIAAVEQWRDAGKLDVATFQASLAYFKARYFPNGQEGHRFQYLEVRPQQRALVASVLSGANEIPADQVKGVLLVVNRLRNNLMHGAKWDDGLQGQRDNFLHANLALMAALECSAT